MKNAVILSLVMVAAACAADPQDPIGGEVDEADEVDASAATAPPDAGADAAAGPAIDHVFVIVMENHDWSSIAGNPSAPYINDTLLAIGAHAEAYYNPPGLHPSQPNYIWLESGATLGLTTNEDPSASYSSGSTDHLVTLLENAGLTWRSYQEDMPSGGCPLSSSGFYAAKHNPFVYFRDVTDDNDPSSPRCIAHIRPMTELQGDLDGGTMANYVFLAPNLCNDMHGASGCPSGDVIARGDAWLAEKVPAIMASPGYQAGRTAILVTWDESGSSSAPIGMIAISPHARAGYASTVPASHSSTLRTLQEIFGVGPLLRDAANANDLSDLFHQLH